MVKKTKSSCLKKTKKQRQSSFLNHYDTKIKNKYTTEHCATRTTADPRIFGPELWRSFHRIAHNYPVIPSKDTCRYARSFLESIPYMLPCPNCGCSFLMYLEENNIDKICSSRDNLVEFFVEVHNYVSKHLDPNKKIWTIQDAHKTYLNEYGCVGHKPVWNGCKIHKKDGCKVDKKAMGLCKL